MIKKIEIWDFESHEHTVIDDFSSGLSLIIGESNCGKTSIVRAFKLVAYNQFDPKSIRVGATKCKVFVETERGSVQVTRGNKNNLWEVTPLGQPTQYLDKVGVNVVPQAAEILGLHIVTLGDVQVPVNIMDQLENHFMLSGVGDKDASGSMRAQIVDEISGLSGIEGLIKSVSLDNHRFGREISEIEEKMKETKKQLNDEAQLKYEEEVVEYATKGLEEYDQCTEVAAMGDVVVLEMNELKNNEVVLEDALSSIPDLDAVGVLLDEAKTNSDKVGEACDLDDEAYWSEEKRNELEQRLAEIPDIDALAVVLKEADVVKNQLISGEGLLNDATILIANRDILEDVVSKIPDIELTMERLKVAEESGRGLVAAETLDQGGEVLRGQRDRLEEEIGQLEGINGAADVLNQAGDVINRIESARILAREALEVGIRMEELNIGVSNCEQELVVAKANVDEILASVTTCPLNNRPVSPECLK